MTTIALTLDRVNMDDTVKLREAVEAVGHIFDPDATAYPIDGAAIDRRQALDVAARLIHETDTRRPEVNTPYANGMAALIFELFGADDLTEEAGLAYVSQELTIRRRRLAS